MLKTNFNTQPILLFGKILLLLGLKAQQVKLKIKARNRKYMSETD